LGVRLGDEAVVQLATGAGARLGKRLGRTFERPICIVQFTPNSGPTLPSPLAQSISTPMNVLQIHPPRRGRRRQRLLIEPCVIRVA
jgi:hypothetical protein